MDFANKRVGGSVLGRGCVQEEIRFVIWAELIASRVFTEVLTDRETFFITGAEQYADYEGYKEEFTFIADVQDSCPRDSMNRRQVCIVAIDALSFRNRPLSQFTETFLLRELNKAYAGFARQSALSSTESSETAHDLCSCSSAPVKARLSWDLCADDSAVATGNWGCGAYSGDKQYKFAIQLLACAHAGREMQFVMFEDDDFPSQIERFVEQIREHDWSGQQLFERLQAYNRHVETKLKERVSFFKFAFDSPGQVYESNDESKVSRRKVKRKGESDSKSSTN